jgi:hypothetical protein
MKKSKTLNIMASKKTKLCLHKYDIFLEEYFTGENIYLKTIERGIIKIVRNTIFGKIILLLSEESCLIEACENTKYELLKLHLDNKSIKYNIVGDMNFLRLYEI